MRITISHNKGRQELKTAVDQSFDDLFQGAGILPFQIVNERRSWDGDKLNFSFGAKMGLLTAPIKGFVHVTDRDITIDADLGLLEKLLPAKQAAQALENKVRGLLQ